MDTTQKVATHQQAEPVNIEEISFSENLDFGTFDAEFNQGLEAFETKPEVKTQKEEVQAKRVKAAPRRPQSYVAENSHAPEAGLNAAIEPISVGSSSSIEYSVQKGDSLWSIAKKNGVSISDLIDNNDINRTDILRIGQKIKIPTSSTKSIQTITASKYTSAEGSTYTVQNGDTLSGIAVRFGVKVADIKAVNNLSSDNIFTGKTLVLPGVTSEKMVTALASTPSAPKTFTQKKLNLTAGGQTHKVASGETLSEIAKLYGATVKDIMEVNGIADAKKLRAGQELSIQGNSNKVEAKILAKTEPEMPISGHEVSSWDLADHDPSLDLFNDDAIFDTTEESTIIPVSQP